MNHFPLSYRFGSYIKRKVLSSPFRWYKNEFSSSTGSGTKRALNFFFKKIIFHKFLRPVLYHFPLRQKIEFHITGKGMACPFFWCKIGFSSSPARGTKKSRKSYRYFLRPILNHFLLSYRFGSYIKIKVLACPFYWCKDVVCSLTESGTKWALKICFMYFLVIFMFIVGF